MKKFCLVKNIIPAMIIMVSILPLTGCGKESKVVYPVEIVEEEEIIPEEEPVEEEVAEEPVITVNTGDHDLPELQEEVDIDVNDLPEEVNEPEKIVDFVIFMGQSNMSGVGGNAEMAPKVPEGVAYEFKAISDPTKLYPLEEPFGKNESFIGAICDFPLAKKGSIVSSFALKYYEETGVPIVAVSASEGATTTERWLSDPYQADLNYRYTTALAWLENNGYTVRKKFAVWLQGESDAANNVTAEEYIQNMDNIIRNLFIGGLNKVFVITPGRTITLKNYFNTIINAQIKMCKESGYYALGTTALCGISTEYMVDEWHYNQDVLNLLGEQTAISVAYYVNNKQEMCVYDYKNHETYIPDLFEYTGEEVVEPLDLSNPHDLLEFKVE